MAIPEIRCGECLQIFVATRKDEHMRSLYHHFLHRHAKIADKDKMICDECDATSILPLRLRDHIFGVHRIIRDDEVHQCDQCNHHTLYKDRLRVHLFTCHGLKTFICDQCGFFSGSKVTVQSHVEVTHSGGVRAKCGICASVFASEQKLKLHENVVHRKDKRTVRICNECRRSFNKVSSLCFHILRRHMQQKAADDGQRFACDKCRQVFGRRSDLWSHIRHRHRFALNSRQCDSCEWATQSTTELAHHFLTQHMQGVTPKVQCQICKQLFLSEQAMQQHKSHHRRNKKLERVCDHCGKRDLTMMHFRMAHSKTSGDQEVSCDVCRKVFSVDLKGSLVRHLSLRHNIGPQERFYCDVCGVYDRLRTRVYEHIIQKHLPSDDAPQQFGCDVCGKEFMKETSRNTHRRQRHGKVGCFECNLCQRRFTTKGVMARHFPLVHWKL